MLVSPGSAMIASVNPPTAMNLTCTDWVNTCETPPAPSLPTTNTFASSRPSTVGLKIWVEGVPSGGLAKPSTTPSVNTWAPTSAGWNTSSGTPETVLRLAQELLAPLTRRLPRMVASENSAAPLRLIDQPDRPVM